MDIEMITQFIRANDIFILAAASTGGIFLFFLFCILTLRTVGLKRRFDRLMKTDSGNSLEDLVVEYMQKIVQLEEENSVLKRRIGALEDAQKSCVQKSGMVRYNAYQNASYNLSFSLALLDGNNDGVVVSSLYGRNECIVYAKPLRGGTSEYTLSSEEEEAVKRALK